MPVWGMPPRPIPPPGAALLQQLEPLRTFSEQLFEGERLSLSGGQRMKRDLYEEVSARIVAELERGAAPWVKAQAAADYLRGLALGEQSPIAA
jgi:hypothetical protein